MFLRQSTASQIVVTPRFVDDTDFKTPETALTIANTDVKLSKAGAASANKNSGGATHLEGGRYTLTLDATDTSTVGRLDVGISVSGALPVEFRFVVVEEAVYDSMFAASAPGYVANAPVSVAQWAGTNVATVDTAGYPKVTIKSGTGTGEVSLAAGLVSANAVQISGDATAADNLETAFDETAGPVPWLGIVDQGTAQAATGTTIRLRAAATFADDTLNGAVVAAYGSTQGYWQMRQITDYTSSTDTATVDTWTVTPSGTITYKVFAVPPGVTIPTADLNAIADAVWDEATSGHSTTGTTGKAVTDAGSGASASTIADAVWDEVLSGHTTSGTAGERMGRIPNAAAGASGGLPTTDSSNGVKVSVGTGTGQVNLSSGKVPATIAAGDLANNSLTAAALATDAVAEIADGVWDEVTSGHSTAGTAGKALTDAGSGTSAATIADAVWDEARTGHTTAGTFGNYLDASVSGVSTGGVSASDIADAVLDEALAGHTTSGSLGKAIADLPSASSIATAVWAAGTRTLSTFGSLVSDTVSGVWAAATRTITGNNDKTGYALTSGERTSIANEVEAQIIDETDSEKVLTAITNKIAAVNPDLSGLTLSAIAAAVRDQAYSGASANSLGDALAKLAARLPGSGTISTLDSSAVQSAATASLNAYDAPTHAEMTAELATADDAVLAAIAALNNLSSSGAQAAAAAALAAYSTAKATDVPSSSTVASAVLAAAGTTPIAANMKKISDVAITGAGTEGNSWRPA